MSLKVGVLMLTASFAAVLSRAAISQPNDPIATRAQVVALLNAHYDEEERKFKVEIDRRKRQQTLYLTGKHLSEVKEALGDKKQIPPLLKPVERDDPCADPKRIFVRRNSLDTFDLGFQDVPTASAKGASVSFTSDDVSDSDHLTINGRVQAVLLKNDPLSSCKDGKVKDPWAASNVNEARIGYAVAPFVDAQGTTSNPKKATEASAIQFGSDFQLSVIGGPGFDLQYVTLTPYYQTDFRGSANIQGFKAGWDPIAPDIRLGGSKSISNDYFNWFWQFRAEYDGRHVSNAGVTGLDRTDYQWAGTVVQIHVDLFPSREDIAPSEKAPYPVLVNRFYLNGMAYYYWDLKGGATAHMWEGEFGYNLTPDGKSAISVKYDNGLDKDTLERVKKYLVSFNYKF